jgi:AcrR family transcriptional regulator
VSAEAARSRPGGRSAEIRNRVLDATIDLLTESGYDGLSIQAVADRAAVHKTTVYRWWPTTGALLAAALLDDIDGLEPADTGTLAGDLAQLSATAPRAGTSGDPMARAIAVTCALDAARDDPDVAAARDRLWALRLDLVRGALGRAEERNEIRPGVDAELLLDVLFGTFHTRVVARGAPFTAYFARQVVAIVLRAPRAC